MTRTVALALFLTGLTLGGCGRMQGGSTTSLPSLLIPGQEALRAIPLGAPPGRPLSAAVAAFQNPFEGNAQAIQEGKTLFGAMNCVYCHGRHGSGLIGPALNDAAWRYGGAPAQIYNSIHDGRPKGMPAWGARLPPDQIWKLVAYVESLGGARPPATSQMVALGGSAPSTTGSQPADQDQADAANQDRTAANAAARRQTRP